MRRTNRCRPVRNHVCTLISPSLNRETLSASGPELGTIQTHILRVISNSLGLMTRQGRLILPLYNNSIQSTISYPPTHTHEHWPDKCECAIKLLCTFTRHQVPYGVMCVCGGFAGNITRLCLYWLAVADMFCCGGRRKACFQITHILPYCQSYKNTPTYTRGHVVCCRGQILLYGARIRRRRSGGKSNNIVSGAICCKMIH